MVKNLASCLVDPENLAAARCLNAVLPAIVLGVLWLSFSLQSFLVGVVIFLTGGLIGMRAGTKDGEDPATAFLGWYSVIIACGGGFFTKSFDL